MDTEPEMRFTKEPEIRNFVLNIVQFQLSFRPSGEIL